jgi:hypothetical protein
MSAAREAELTIWEREWAMRRERAACAGRRWSGLAEDYVVCICWICRAAIVDPPDAAGARGE